MFYNILMLRQSENEWQNVFMQLSYVLYSSKIFKDIIMYYSKCIMYYSAWSEGFD